MNIFGTPIQTSFVVQDDLDRALENSGILSFLEENTYWNCSVETSYFNDEQKDCLSKLKSSMDKCILPFAVNYIKPFLSAPSAISFQHAWVNKYTPGKFQERHSHGGSEVSFVYMYKTTEQHSVLRFYNPMDTHIGDISERTGVLFEPLEFDVFLQPREVIFFPSYLAHSVVPYNTDGERVTFSGNIRVNRGSVNE